MLKYYIPMVYTFTTRYNNIFAAISFLFFTCLPSLFFVILNNEITVGLLVNYCMVFYVMYAAYECGYLFNDIITVQFEEKPTIRIEKKYFNNISRHLENMLTLRLIIIGIGLFFIYYFDKNAVYFLCTILLLFIVYSMHNFYRNRINICTMFFLVLLKNVIPLLPFINFTDVGKIILVLTISIVFPRTYEFSTKERFNLHIESFNVDLFRVKYYSIACVFMLFISQVGYISLNYTILPLFFLLYRVFIYILLNSTKVQEKVNFIREKK